MNPSLPTVVYCIPICCRLPATKSMTPQQIPPSSRFFRLPGVFPAFSSFAPVLCNTAIHGISPSPPLTFRHSAPQPQRPRSLPSKAAAKIVSSQTYSSLYYRTLRRNCLASGVFGLKKISSGFPSSRILPSAIKTTLSASPTFPIRSFARASVLPFSIFLHEQAPALRSQAPSCAETD